jgi:cytochrome d ubiquinol oxidase subunit I
MKKIVILVLAYVIFLFILVMVIAPQQGEQTSSTSQNAGQLGNADPATQENLPIQETDLGPQGRSIFIAVVMLAHMLFANLQLGGAWVAAGTESLFLVRKKARYDRMARSISLFNLILIAAGATFAATGLFFFFGLFPKLSSYEFHIWWWPLLGESILFASQILLVGLYWFSWGKIGNKIHQLLGYGFAVATFFQTLMINTLAAGMLTPGGSTLPFQSQSGISLTTAANYFSWWINATTWNLQLHRIGAAISFFGFVLAMLGVFHFLDRKDLRSKQYWDWAVSYGMVIGLAGFLLQPILGLEYMTSIMHAQPAAFEQMMHGPRAWAFVLMVGLFSIIAIAATTYFIDRREKTIRLFGSNRARWMMYLILIAVVVSGLILVQPAWLGGVGLGAPGVWRNPLGIMPLKYVGLFVISVCCGFLLLYDVIFLSAYKESQWGNLPRASRAAAAIAGFTGMWLLVVMGYIRESGRSPWTIYGIVPVPGGQLYPTPIALPTIFVIWAAILGLALVVYWFTSRMTASHPEQMEG